MRRERAEWKALEESCVAEDNKHAYLEELDRRIKAEVALAKEKEKNTKITSMLIDHIAEYERKLEAMKEKRNSALELLQRVMRERDMALDEAKELWRNLANESSLANASSISTQPPDHFNCPISHEVMEDPHVARDGFTYEKANIIRWLRTGRSTSPMTKENLSETDLVPNHPLRSAILEWRRHHIFDLL
ncbi:PREDICTED: U-box domain-containing protein 36-like [Tarenaya hassleriana]|uniref:U-box domain-containing protein 36-like n=1 Tax=Tarenaya hassleriana TaxID=28532 RepID=UPI0008FD7F16|nr:PREDICTED: U-box domain-containing protein 36-like [Tarenaya hassleriana]